MSEEIPSGVTVKNVFNLPLNLFPFNISYNLCSALNVTTLRIIKLYRYVYENNNSYTVIHILYTVMCRTHQFNLFCMSTIELHIHLKLHAILH